MKITEKIKYVLMGGRDILGVRVKRKTRPGVAANTRAHDLQEYADPYTVDISCIKT